MRLFFKAVRDLLNKSVAIFVCFGRLVCVLLTRTFPVKNEKERIRKCIYKVLLRFSPPINTSPFFTDVVFKTGHILKSKITHTHTHISSETKQ